MVGRTPKQTLVKLEPRQLRSSTLAATAARQPAVRNQETPKLIKNPPTIATFSTTTDPGLQFIDALIQKYLQTAQRETALFWVDKRLSLCQKDSDCPSFSDIAEFLKVLAQIDEYTRTITFIRQYDLTMKHVVFAYYYVNALFHRKSYEEILKLKLSSLDGFTNPVTSVEPFKSEVFGAKSCLPNKRDKTFLDAFANNLKAKASLLLLLGKTFLFNQNRRDAQLCLQLAIEKDPCMAEALKLIQKYNLYKSKLELEKLIEKVCSAESGVKDAFKPFYFLQGKFLGKSQQDALLQDSKADLSLRTAYASYLYQIGNFTESNRVTSKIMEETGVYQDALLVHIATLVLLKKHEELFMLGHKLVDTQPDSELSWYTVGCYYYSIGNYTMAKNFLNKCTMMRSLFGEGWLAFGHVLSAESEHEQATNCYLRASRVHEGCFEPFMYAGLEYAYANSTKLAQEFLKDSAELAGPNALVLHEEACIYYMNKDYDSADEYFTRALKVAYGRPVNDKVNVISLLHLTLSDFWEPLINNLAHLRRRRGKHSDSLKFYQKSLIMRPRNAAALCGMATTYASLGEVELAVQFFNEALGISPQSQIIKQGLDKLLSFLENNPLLASSPFVSNLTCDESGDHFMSQTDAEVFNEELNDRQKWAIEVYKKKPFKKEKKTNAVARNSGEADVAGPSKKTTSIAFQMQLQESGGDSLITSTADMEIDEEDD